MPGEPLALNLSAIKKALKRLARNIFKTGEIPARLDENVVNQMADKLLEGVEEGYGDKLVDLDYGTPDYEMEASLKNDVWQFSGAKNYQQMKAMTEALTGPDGKIRSYIEFKKTVRPIIEDHTEWLQTEYRTAIASSQMAAKWVRIWRDRKTLPLLQFDAVIDNRTTELCHSLNGVIRKVEDPFWDVYYPPNHFNCRSDVRQLSDGGETNEEDIQYPDIPNMFRTNVSKQGLVFPAGSSYYKGLPDHILREAKNLLIKNDFNYLRQELVRPHKTVKNPALHKEIGFTSTGIKEAYNQPHKHYDAKNMLMVMIDEILSKAEYLGFSTYKSSDAVKGSHIFEIQIKGDPSWLIVREMINGDLTFYSISDSPNVLINIKK